MKIASTGVPTRFSTGGLTVALAPALRELDLKLLGMQWDTSSLVSSCPEYKSLLLVAGQITSESDHWREGVMVYKTEIWLLINLAA